MKKIIFLLFCAFSLLIYVQVGDAAGCCFTAVGSGAKDCQDLVITTACVPPKIFATQSCAETMGCTQNSGGGSGSGSSGSGSGGGSGESGSVSGGITVVDWCNGQGGALPDAQGVCNYQDTSTKQWTCKQITCSGCAVTPGQGNFKAGGSCASAASGGGSPSAPSYVDLPDPLGFGFQGNSKDDTNLILAKVGNIIDGFLAITGSIALLMFIYGGVLWLTSAGNSERIKTGRDVLMWAVLGLVLIFSSYFLVDFVVKGVG